jgi:bifunctional non-homologous end joining protein LigD
MIAEAAARRRAVLVVFDLLQLDGRDLRALPLLERSAALHAHVPAMAGIQLIEHVETYGAPLFDAIAADEGVVAKRTDASYRAGSTRVAEDQKPRVLAS